ncbi:MAG: hypothetical protein ACK5NK_03645 [Niabella sp.]
MRLVKLTTLKKYITGKGIVSSLLLFGFSLTVQAQDNSPYSRYGIGDKFPGTGATNRAMGGISAAYNDYFNINYNNPASYAFFQAVREPNSHKLSSGRAVLNIGVDGQTRTLIDNDVKKRFTSSELLFSHMMLGLPLRKNWGMALGLRPLYRVNYKMESSGIIADHNTNLPIDSGYTLSEGQGGAYLATIGTGVKFAITKTSYLSLGVNGGYMFGKKDYSTRLSLIGGDEIFAAGNKQTKTGIGGLYVDMGAQYEFKVNNKLYMNIGAYGNMNQKTNTSSDKINETYTYNTDQGYIRKDSVYEETGIKGSFDYPASFTAGFVLRRPQFNSTQEAGWLIGLDFTQTYWDKYRLNGVADANVKSNWQLKLGTELNPVRKNNYFSLVAYRMGLFTGPDYLYINNNTIPTYGVSFGLGMPLINYNGAMAGYQQSVLNLGFEYVKRGNDKNVLKENLFRISAGFSLSDLWYIKRRYRD